jgi:DNA polymerase-3 subunit delta'
VYPSYGFSAKGGRFSLHKTMIFNDIIGQERTKTFLLQLAQSERVPHALLFLGPTGSGNLALAVAFAQLLQSEPAISNQQSTINPLTHPDIHFSFPTVGTNAVSTDYLKEWRAALSENPYMDANAWLQRLGAENKQGNITKEECNAIIKKLSLKAFEGRYKILVMWLPEYLGKEGNRLLKLIEEPPENTIFLLAAENQDLILNTIVSRCQLVKTGFLSDEEVAEGLRQKRGLDANRARQIAFLADGDFNAALQIADHPDNDDARLLLDWLRKCWRGNGAELMKWTEEFAKLGRENQKQFLHYGLHFLREMMALVATGNPNLRLQPEELATAQNMAKVLDFEKITQIVGLFNDNIYYVERNANPKILFLDTSIQMNRIMKNA